MSVNNTRSGPHDGMDIAAYRGFIEWVAANPEAATLAFHADGVAADVARRATATIGSWDVDGTEKSRNPVDRSRVDGSAVGSAMAYHTPAGRVDAVEVALTALTTCLSGTIADCAARDGLAIEGLTTSVSIPLDARALFDHPHRVDDLLGAVEISIDVVAPGLTDAERCRLERYWQCSPVFRLFAGAHTTTPTVAVRAA